MPMYVDLCVWIPCHPVIEGRISNSETRVLECFKMVKNPAEMSNKNGVEWKVGGTSSRSEFWQVHSTSKILQLMNLMHSTYTDIFSR